MFYELLGLYLLFLAIPTKLIYFRKKCLKGLKKVTEKERQERAQLEEINYMKLQKQLREIYEVESKPLYLKARYLFNNSMKSGKLHKAEIDYLEKLINESLGHTLTSTNIISLKAKLIGYMY